MKLNEQFNVFTVGSYVILEEEKNPFIEERTESGLYLPHGLHVETQETEGSGKIVALAQQIRFARVKEVGPECKYLVEGDGVYFDHRSVVLFPVSAEKFLIRTSEQHIIAYVRENINDTKEENDSRI